MCEPVTAIRTTLGVAGGILDAKNQNAAWAAQETAYRKQKLEMVRQANTQDAALQLQSSNAFEQARLSLESASMDAIKVQSSVESAIGESNLEGNSMDRIRRETGNVYLRTKGTIDANYQRDYANILGQRISNRDNLISGIKGMAAPHKPSKFGQITNVVEAGLSGLAQGEQLQGIVDSMPKGDMFGTQQYLESSRQRKINSFSKREVR